MALQIMFLALQHVVVSFLHLARSFAQLPRLSQSLILVANICAGPLLVALLPKSQVYRLCL